MAEDITVWIDRLHFGRLLTRCIYDSFKSLMESCVVQEQITLHQLFTHTEIGQLEIPYARLP